jgi:hypothetical protein
MLMRQEMIQEPEEDFDECFYSLKVDNNVKHRIGEGEWNESQRQAGATVVSPGFRKGFFAVQGPPGTGKTSCLVSMILDVTVANVARKVFKTNLFKLQEISVFGENSDQYVHFLSPRHRGKRFGMMREHYELAGEQGKHEKQESLFREFLSWLHTYDNKLSMVDLQLAIIRAKRILRVVGDAVFFRSLQQRSILKMLWEYALEVSAYEKARLRQVAWSRPNWSEPTRWKVVANAQFYGCVGKMHGQD